MGKLTLPIRTPKLEITTLIPASASEPWLPTMQTANLATDSLLLRQLRLFVAEVVRTIASYDNKLIMSDEATSSAHTAAEEVCDKLTREIDTQTMEISRIGAPADRAAVEELRYLKAAIADEFLLSRPWPGQSRFTETLIETRLFGSSISGDKIFEQIDALLAETSGPPPQMAPLYLFAIAIGFEGRYRGIQADRKLQPLRDALFRKIYRREPTLAPGLASQPVNAERVLSPQAYRYPLSNIVPVRFFRFSRGFVGFIGVMLLLLVLSEVLWRVTSAPVRKALEPAMPARMQQTVPNEGDRG
jgi:type VI secretion system protein ImpK